jgi:tetratricopeptide (TPR) repeat protein
VASVHEHARFFALQADRYGGGHIRTSLAAHLSGLVRTLRRGEEGVHQRGMQAGAARLSFLLARVYADEQRHGLAQRAFLTAAELAAEAADPEGVALARRALSSQAHQLGHPRASLALADAALAAAPADTEPSTRAFLYAGLAVARAACGDRSRALDALSRAERQLARAPVDLTTGAQSPNGEPVGTYQSAALLYQAGQVRAALGDREGAIRELRASLRARPADECRTRALCQAELAELLLRCGRLEEACSVWSGFLEVSSQVRSGRVLAARSRVRALLRPYASSRPARTVLTGNHRTAPPPSTVTTAAPSAPGRSAPGG